MFLAVDPSGDRQVAVKAFPLDITPERAAELAKAFEVLSAAHLGHPSIVPPLAAGAEGSTAYLVQEYVLAESVDAAIRQYGPAPVPDALRLIGQLAGALDFAAVAGVHHGALHPRDVLVAPNDVRLTGLGVAQAFEQVGLRVAARRPYSAPERQGNRAWGAPADVFSLAAVGFEILTGRRPGSVEALAAETRGIPAADPAALAEVFGRALGSRPGSRYQTALAFAAALRHALTGEALEIPEQARSARSRGVAAGAATAVPAEPSASAEAGSEPTVEQAEAEAVEQAEAEAEGPAEAEAAGPAEAEAAGPAQPESRAAGAAPTASDAAPAQPEGTEGWEEPEPPPVEEADPGAPLVEAERPSLAAEASALEEEPEPPPVEEARLAGAAAANLPLRRVEGEEEEYQAPELFQAGERWEAEAVRQDEPATEELAPAAEPELPLLPLEAEAPPAPFAGVRQPAPGGQAVPARAGEEARMPPREPAAGMRRRETTMPVGDLGGASARRPRFPLSSLVAMLLLGIVAGFTLGYFVGRGEPEPPAPVAAPPSEAAPTGLTAAGGDPTLSKAPTVDSPSAPEVLAPEPQAPEPAGAAEPPPAASREPRAGGGEGERAAARPPAPAPSARGAERFEAPLAVISRPPGALVRLDGRPVGKTPLTLKAVAAGSHVVRLEMNGYAPWTTAIQVVTGKQNRVTASLDRRPGGIE